MDLTILKYFNFLFGPTTKIIYIYIYNNYNENFINI